MTSTDLPELDNPFWFSLLSRHRECASRDGDAARYPADIAPFLGVASTDADVDASLSRLVAPEESVYLLGVVPALPASWSVHAYPPLAQMICPERIEPVEGPPITALDDRHRDDVLALIALVYPHYFRSRTMTLGRYFGIYQNGQLAALIGERLGTDATQEISAICTHPDFTGRGHARRLIAMLSNDTLERGRLPYLHVSNENDRALGVYRDIGYRQRRDIGFWSLRRAT